MQVFFSIFGAIIVGSSVAYWHDSVVLGIESLAHNIN
jgi:hypothetical protein